MTGDVKYYDYIKCLQISFFRYYLNYFTSLFSESIKVSNPAMAPIQSDSLAINFEFDKA